MGALTTLSSEGQLTIPKDVLDELKIPPGTQFYVMVRDGQVVAVPRNKSIMDFAGILGPPPNGTSLTLEEIDEVIMDAVVEDDDRIQREWHEGRK